MSGEDRDFRACSCECDPSDHTASISAQAVNEGGGSIVYTESSFKAVVPIDLRLQIDKTKTKTVKTTSYF